MPHIYLKNKLQCIYPFQLDFQEEKEELEYWESEDNKTDDEMNELSDDPDLEKEEVVTTKKPEKNKEHKNIKSDSDNSEEEPEEEHNVDDDEEEGF